MTAPLPMSLVREPRSDGRRMVVALERMAVALERLVELNAPAAGEPGTPLPEEFPGREALAQQGIIYLESVPRKGDELTALGLDGRTVNRVLSYLRAVV